ncbi:MAG: hypothetical protein RL060_1442 [Bacteroidota bacterium]|jgi:hypothetical protein
MLGARLFGFSSVMLSLFVWNTKAVYFFEFLSKPNLLPITIQLKPDLI